jgi:ABC-type histidine transport system ATPase subunit
MLFDEPTSALDPELVNEVLEVMRTLAKDGTIMNVVTHELTSARQIAGRVMFLKDGLIVEFGSPNQIFGDACSDETRQFRSHFVNRDQFNAPRSERKLS